MAYRFPSTVNAGRVAKFISTAAWLQGASVAAATAGNVWLPEEALNNFLARQAPDNGNGVTQPPPVDDDAESGSEGSSSGDAESIDSSKSSDSETSTKDGESPDNNTDRQTIDGVPATTPFPVQGTIDPSTGATEMPAPADAGSSVVNSGLSPGAQAAIAVWVVIGVVGAATAFWWFYLRRKRAAASQNNDPEGGRSQAMAAQGALPSILPPPPLESRQSKGDYVMRAQAWRDDAASFDTRPLSQQSKRMSPPQGYYGATLVNSPTSTRSESKIGLPSNPRPLSRPSSGPVIGAPMMGGPYPRDMDARTVVTADTESTIFEWR